MNIAACAQDGSVILCSRNNMRRSGGSGIYIRATSDATSTATTTLFEEVHKRPWLASWTFRRLQGMHFCPLVSGAWSFGVTMTEQLRSRVGARAPLGNSCAAGVRKSDGCQRPCKVTEHVLLRRFPSREAPGSLRPPRGARARCTPRWATDCAALASAARQQEIPSPFGTTYIRRRFPGPPDRGLL